MQTSPLGVVPDESDAAQQELVARYRDTIVDAQSRLYDKAMAYSNLIMVGGYAGAFTIWGKLSENLTLNANLTVALSVGASLLVFLLFQVYKMTFHVLHFNKIRILLSSKLTIVEFLERWNALEKRQAQFTMLHDTRASGLCLVVCLVTALIGVFILFYNFVALLIGWPIWPC